MFSKHLIFDSKMDDSINYKTICPESSKFERLKVQIPRIVTTFTMGTVVIIYITPAIALA
jgi:hypothetical protein